MTLTSQFSQEVADHHRNLGRPGCRERSQPIFGKLAQEESATRAPSRATAARLMLTFDKIEGEPLLPCCATGDLPCRAWLDQRST
jgi:hypothetical protein